MADSMKKSFKVCGSGFLQINNGKITIVCEDKGEYDLDVVLEELNEHPVKFSFSYDEDYVAPDVDEETGEVL